MIKVIQRQSAFSWYLLVNFLFRSVTYFRGSKICDSLWQGGQKSSKKAWHTLWTAPMHLHVHICYAVHLHVHICYVTTHASVCFKPGLNFEFVQSHRVRHSPNQIIIIRYYLYVYMSICLLVGIYVFMSEIYIYAMCRCVDILIMHGSMRTCRVDTDMFFRHFYYVQCV